MVDKKGHPIVIMGGGIKSNLEKALKDYIECTLYGKTKDGITIYDFLKGNDCKEDQIYTAESYKPKTKDI